jgi:hypothetical protein
VAVRARAVNKLWDFIFLNRNRYFVVVAQSTVDWQTHSKMAR